MQALKERYEKWKLKKWYSKLGDILFYLFIIAILIPGPRKFVATNVNKVILHIRKPSIGNEESAYQLSKQEYNWDIVDERGNAVLPEDLMGEVVFLNFWGTYCPPCIAEMPEIQAAYDGYGDRVKFILVSAEDPEKVNRFLKSKNYNLPTYYGGRNLPDPLSISSIPTTFIISKNGKIISRKVGAADWNSRATRKVFDELLAR
ncbi:MAG TPA: TlpA disulfide reductase family protein [Bacteroidales bacterium]|nr:TlpA disulfide reductase family protein [Bacteroidales bacterium]